MELELELTWLVLSTWEPSRSDWDRATNDTASLSLTTPPLPCSQSLSEHLAPI